jgi:membrane protease YdiL (CAAX protease family)
LSPSPDPLTIAVWLLTTLVGAGLFVDLKLLSHLRAQPPDRAGCVRALLSRPWTGRDAVVVGGLFLTLCGVALLVLSAARHVGFLSAGDTTYLALFLQTAWMPFFALLGVALLLRVRRYSLAEAFGFQQSQALVAVRRGIVFYLGLMPPFLLCAWVSVLILTRLDIPLERQFVVGLLADPSCSTLLKVHIVLVATFVAPVLEEAIFRGILLPVVARHTGTGLGVCLISLLFALVHFNLASFVPLFLLAAALALAYIWTRSLLVSIVMHGMFNAWNIAILLLVSRGSPDLRLPF